MLPLLVLMACTDAPPATTPPTSTPVAPAPPLDDAWTGDPSLEGVEAWEEDGERRARTAGQGRLGAPAPTGEVLTLDGGRFSLDRGTRGRPLYIKFWATWCAPCLAQMPAFKELAGRMEGRVDVLAVNVGLSDPESAVRAYARRHALPMPVTIDDGRLARAFGLTVTPQHVLVGRDGRIAWVGHKHGPELEEALARLLDSPAEAVAAPPPLDPPTPVRLGEAVGSLPLGEAPAVDLGAEGVRRGLLFLAPWCESYLAETRPTVAGACKAAREKVEARPPGENWVIVAHGLWTQASEVEEFRTQHALRTPIVLDPSGVAFDRFGVRELPAIAIVDAEGRLAWRGSGPELDLDAAFAALGAPPP